MERIKILILVLLLSGCGLTPQGDTFREFLETRAQKAADQTARNALEYLCKYARVSSVNKLFAHMEDRRAYLILCSNLAPLIPITPEVFGKGEGS